MNKPNINHLTEVARSLMFYLVIMLIAAFVLWFIMEALVTEAINRDHAQAEYVKNLERTLAKCLSGKDQPIQVGNEVWFCGATNSGVKL